MAVTITVADALVAARIVVDGTKIPAPILSAGTVLHASASAEITRHAPDAPDAVSNAALVRMLAHLWELDTAGNPRGYQSALRNSGAAGSLAPWRAKRAGIIEEVISETSEAGGPGVDQTARDAAAAAQQTADAAEQAAQDAGGIAAANHNFLTTFVARVRAVVEAVVPAWARMPNPPSGGGGALADGSVTTAKLADDAVTGRKIAADAVATGHLADNAVTAAKIPSDAVQSRHIAADAVTGAEIAGGAVDTAELADDGVVEAKLAAAVRQKLNDSGTAGDDAYDWATQGNTDLIPVAKVPRIASVVPGENAAAIARAVAGEKDGDLAIGYTADTVTVYKFAAPPTNAWQPQASWARGGRTDAALEAFIERIVSAWAIVGNADGIPGAKTFDGLFRSEGQTAIPAANVTVTFDVGNADDGNETDETDAAASNFAITEQQANQPGAFVRCRYTLQRIKLSGAAPHDIELQLQTAAGAVLGKHNIKDEGSGTAQFPVGDAGQHRWAVRVVTDGRYEGDVVVSESTYHSGTPLADPAVEHVVHPIVSDEAEKRQSEDAALRTEIARVEQIKAIVNGLPAATATVKKNVLFQTDKPWLQTEADAFQVPATGFVQFILGNIGATGIMPVAYCANRGQIVHAQGNHEIALEFGPTRKAVLSAKQTRNNTRSNLAVDVYSTTVGFVMLHWAAARPGGDPDAADPNKADKDLQNVDADLTDEQKATVRKRIGAAEAGAAAGLPAWTVITPDAAFWGPYGAGQPVTPADNKWARIANNDAGVSTPGLDRGAAIVIPAQAKQVKITLRGAAYLVADVADLAENLKVAGAGATFDGVAIAAGSFESTPVFRKLKFALDSERRLLGSLDNPDGNLNRNYRVSWR